MITWIMISNSLNIDFIHNDIPARSYKNNGTVSDKLQWNLKNDTCNDKENFIQ